MSNNEQNDIVYAVVMNDEEQYSIWPADREVPNGWRTSGVSGTKSECLDYIEKVWTDMRPASLRRAMDQRSIPPDPTD
jgi:MbtH protein